MEILSKKITFKSKLFNVVASKVKLPNKKIRTYFTAERNPSVFVFPIDENYEIYLTKQYRYMIDEETIEAAAGFIEDGEDSLTAAKRELKEETGLSASHWLSLGRVELAASVFKSRAEVFIARGLTKGDQSLDEAEDIKVVKIPLEKALEKIDSKEIIESGTMLGILLLDRLRRENKI